MWSATYLRNLVIATTSLRMITSTSPTCWSLKAVITVELSQPRLRQIHIVFSKHGRLFARCCHCFKIFYSVAAHRPAAMTVSLRPVHGVASLALAQKGTLRWTDGDLIQMLAFKYMRMVMAFFFVGRLSDVAVQRCCNSVLRKSR